MTMEQRGPGRVRLRWRLTMPFGQRPSTGQPHGVPASVPGTPKAVWGSAQHRPADLELTISSLRVALAAERSARIADVARLEHLIASHVAACAGLVPPSGVASQDAPSY